MKGGFAPRIVAFLALWALALAGNAADRPLVRLDSGTWIDLTGGATLILDTAPLSNQAGLAFRLHRGLGGKAVLYLFPKGLGEVLATFTLENDRLSISDGSATVGVTGPSGEGLWTAFELRFDFNAGKYSLAIDGKAAGTFRIREVKYGGESKPASELSRVQVQPGCGLDGLWIGEGASPTSSTSESTSALHGGRGTHAFLSSGRPYELAARTRLTLTLPQTSGKSVAELTLRSPQGLPYRATLQALGASKRPVEICSVLVDTTIQIASAKFIESISHEALYGLRFGVDAELGRYELACDGKTLPSMPFTGAVPMGDAPVLRSLFFSGGAAIESLVIYARN